MTYGDISARVGLFAVANMLEHAEPILVLEKYAEVKPIPKNKSQTLVFRRPVPFQPSTVALTEGVTPVPQMVEYEDVTATIAQYGQWMPFTDVIQDTHEDEQLKNLTMLSGEQAASTKELLIWNVLRAGSNVVYSGTANSRATVTAPLDENDLAYVQSQLKLAHGKPITKKLSASTNISTEPVAPAYLAFGSTALEPILRQLDGFVVREKYASGSPVSDYEIGKWQDIRFILTPQLIPFAGAGASGKDVYPLVVIAQHAFAVTPLKGRDSVQIGVKNPTMAGDSTDPLGQRGYVAWKMWFGVCRLNEAWIYRIESTLA